MNTASIILKGIFLSVLLMGIIEQVSAQHWLTELYKDLFNRIDGGVQDGGDKRGGEVNGHKFYTFKTSDRADGVNVDNLHLVHVKPSEINLVSQYFNPSSGINGVKTGSTAKPFNGGSASTSTQRPASTTEGEPMPPENASMAETPATEDAPMAPAPQPETPPSEGAK